MVRVSSPAKLRPWSELTAKMVMGVVIGLVTRFRFWFWFLKIGSGGSGSSFGSWKNGSQCHAEGGATKGGVSKCEQTQTNADKHKPMQRRNASKRKQTWTNANKRLHPPSFAVFTPPFAIPLGSDGSGFRFPVSVPFLGHPVSCLLLCHSAA